MDLSGFGGVSCVSPSDCFAVGTDQKAHVSPAFIEHLRGSTWKIVRSQNPSRAALAVLFGVACASARACWAVGGQARAQFAAPGKTLAERWNGTRWSIVPTP